ncbi:MAG: sulfite exporter TauE/SafE family protein [Erysipelotrichaceae bacterium]
MIVIYGLVVLLGSIIQGITGFGAGLLITPILGLFTDTRVLVPLLTLSYFSINLSNVIELNKSVNIKNILIVTIFALICTPVGVQIAQSISISMFNLVIGTLIFVMGLIFVLNIKVEMKQTKIKDIFFGSLSGIFNGISSLGGPPVIIYFAGMQMDKNQFRGMNSLYFLLLNIVNLISYFMIGDISVLSLYNILLFVGCSLAGAQIGRMIVGKVNDQLFKKIIAYTLLFNGVIAILLAL